MNQVSFKSWVESLLKRIVQTSFDLFKLMIPIIIMVKVIEELGGIDLIGVVLEPVMHLVGLPASMGLVWAATLLSGIYGGMIIFVGLAGHDVLTVAQVTVVATMMLIAHSIPIETSVARKAGVDVRFSLIFRLVSALIAGMILHHAYQFTGGLSEANVALWSPEIRDSSLIGWALFQLKTLLQIGVIITVLVTFLDLLRLSGIERVFIWALQPLLRILGLDKGVASMTIVGMTLGLTYGGALLINEAKYGDLSARQVFGAISLISICHALIEDTLLVMLLGGHWSGVLLFRVVFCLLLIALGLRAIRRIPERVFSRYLAQSVKASTS